MDKKNTQGIYGINASKNTLQSRTKQTTKTPKKKKTFKPGAELSKKVG
jgi:hypothetical protein